jgi:CO/xanthine dehydrogenase Mo-binding subunit
MVEGSFRTSWVYQGYVEPQAATAWVEPDGTLAVTSATQGTFHTRDNLAWMFGIPVAKVRVAGATIGGGFGGKLMVIEPLVAGAALCLRREPR